VPQATIDPVMMAARFVADVQSVVSREKDPMDRCRKVWSIAESAVLTPFCSGEKAESLGH